MEREVVVDFSDRHIIMHANAAEGWHDVTLSRTPDGWYEVKAFVGYDGFAVRQFDDIDEAYFYFDDWRAGIDEMALKEESKEDVDTDD